MRAYNKSYVLYIFGCSAFLILAITGRAQHNAPDIIQADSTIARPVFDGKLTDACWQSAASVSNFTQRELDYGKPASEETRVAVVYDKLAIYIGVWCFQKAGSIRAKYMQRDFLYSEDDNFQVALSPFNDKRNGYLFVINPNGARADLLISGNEEEDANLDWNGVWDVRTHVNQEGWFAEIRIPFSTLQYKKNLEQNWAINFERNIRAKNEQVLWQGWTRDCSLLCLVNAGSLSGLKNLGYAKRFEFKPYLLGATEKFPGQSTDWQGKAGADLNVIITPTIKLNLTVNTDFAQVEADRIAVNLSRFNLFYPEKREFFLEGYQNYQFNLGNENEVFYTRKIGIENFKNVSIIAGGRLFGKIGKNNIGILNITTAGTDSISATNNSVIRYKKDIGSQSYIGGILTTKNNNLVSNQVAGLDGAYTTSELLGSKNLTIGGMISRSFDKKVKTNDAYSWRVYAEYPNDLVTSGIAVSSVHNNYKPELGFLDRKDFDNISWELELNPRWLTKYGIRRMNFEAWDFQIYRTHSTGDLESFYNQTRPVGFFTKSGERLEFNLNQQFERLDEPFELTDSVSIPEGEYWMHRQEIQLGTFEGRKFWADLSLERGDFYTGKITAVETNIGINVNKHLNIRTKYIFNHAKLPQGRVITNELAQYVNYAFNPRLDFAMFVQWNSLDDLMSGNFRLHWIPNIGSDLYIVYNRGYDDLRRFDLRQPAFSAGAAKLLWRFTF